MTTTTQTPTPLRPTRSATGHLGTLVERPNGTPTEDLRAAFGLDMRWEYRQPHDAYMHEGRFVSMPVLDDENQPAFIMPVAIYPDGTRLSPRNTVSNSYSNNEELLKLFSVVRDLEDADIATAQYGGPTHNLSRAVVQMKLKDDTLVNGDRYGNWIMFSTSFDGTQKFTVSIGATRYWCDNMRQIISDERVLSKSHRNKDARWSATWLRDELLAITNLTTDYWKALERMHETPIVPNHYTAFLTGVFGLSPDQNDPKFYEIDGTFNKTKFDTNMTRWWHMTDEFNETYNSVANRDVRGTIAGLYEARLQMLQYEETNKGVSKDGAFKAIIGHEGTVRKQNKAFSLAQRLMTAGV